MEITVIVGVAGLVLGFIAGTLVAHNNAKNVQDVITAVNTAKDAVTAHVTASSAPPTDATK